MDREVRVKSSSGEPEVKLVDQWPASNRTSALLFTLAACSFERPRQKRKVAAYERIITVYLDPKLIIDRTCHEKPSGPKGTCSLTSPRLPGHQPGENTGRYFPLFPFDETQLRRSLTWGCFRTVRYLALNLDIKFKCEFARNC